MQGVIFYTGTEELYFHSTSPEMIGSSSLRTFHVSYCIYSLKSGFGLALKKLSLEKDIEIYVWKKCHSYNKKTWICPSC